jgi:hypothetical protein
MSKFFKGKKECPEAPRTWDGRLQLSVSRQEVYEEKPGDEGCYRKRAYWECSVHPDYMEMHHNGWWDIKAQAETRTDAIVAAVELVLEKFGNET